MADLTTLKSLVESKNQDGLITFLNEMNIENVGYDKLCPKFEDYYILKDLLKNGHKDMAMTCINAGFRVFEHIHHERSESLMHLAVALGCPKIVQSLLDRKTDLYLKNSYQETPLILAAICGNDQITNMILSHINSKNCSSKEGFSHFHIACMQNCVDKVKNFLIFGADINQCINENVSINPGFTGLHFAVQARSFETVEFLVRSGADITIKDKRGLTPLHLAFRMRNNQMVNSLLSVHHYFMSNPADPENLSHFHIACAMNNLDLVKDFAEKQLKVDHMIASHAHIWSDNDAITFAIQNDCTNIVKYLLTDDRLVNWELASNILTCANVKGNAEILGLIKSKLEKDIIQAECNYKVPVHLVKRKSVSCTNDNPDIDNTGFKRQKLSQYTELHLSVMQNYGHNIGSILRNHDHSVILQQDACGRTPVHLAFETDQKEAIVLMLRLHLELDDENPVDKNGLSHFHIACTINNLDIVTHFMKKGVDINVPVKMDSPVHAGWTALHFAVAAKSAKVTKALLENGADYVVKNAAGSSSFDLAIPSATKFHMRNADDGDSEWRCAMQILLAHNRWKRADFNPRGVTLLHAVCAVDVVDAVRCLITNTSMLNNVIDVDVELWGGYTPLHIAVHYDNEAAMKVLLEHNADVSVQTAKRGWTAAGCVWSERKPIDEKLFITDANLYDREGSSQFHKVFRSITDISAVRHFLKLGVDVNEPIPISFGHILMAGKTPLQLAVDRNNVEMVKLLLENGADVHARDCNLSTPLHECKSTASLKLLMQYGADSQARNCDLESALASASQWCEDADFLTALLECGLDLNDRTRYCGSMIDYKRLGVPSLIVVAKHIRRLSVLGLKISESAMEAFRYARSTPQFNGYEFERLCREELGRMKMIKVDNRASLYDLLLKDTYSMGKYSNNETVKQLMQSEIDLKKQYPIYSYLLILQFKRGLERTSSLQEAKKALSILSNSTLSDDEMHCVFQYLNNRELMYLNQAVDGLEIGIVETSINSKR